jgi:uncharacterized protein YndB with AHSA1/START domain
MSTLGIAANPRTAREWKKLPSTEHPFSTSATTSVNADRHRIYQALTEPEYVEAWFSAPGALAGSTAVFSQENSLSIRYFCTPQQQFRILCSYQVRRRSKLVFTWQHFLYAEATSSVVKIRLHGDFGRTIVHVTHVGLTQSEQELYECLWVSSLRKLSKLF